MSKSNTHETNYLNLIFNNVTIPNLSTNLYIALYTADPGETDAGTEATYTSYARVSVVRTSAGWTVSGNEASNTVAIVFPTSGGTNNTITHFGVLTASTGGDLIGSGTLTASLLVESGDSPKFDVGDLTITED